VTQAEATSRPPAPAAARRVPPHPHRRRVVRAAAGVVVALLAVALAGVPLLVAPPQAPPGTADVVVVLGPPQPWRVAWARELVESGRAGAILVSVDADDHVPLCEDPGDLVVRCARPDPFTTRGEARWIRDELRAHGWTTATVVTAAPNLLRARLLVERCVDDGVQVVARREPIGLDRWAMRYAWQAAGWTKALTTRGC